MKTFETPYVDVVKFEVADIMTASGETEEILPSFMGTTCFSG